MTPLISVLIVNYNSGSYALACVDSLLQQHEVQLEIILVDNASPDNSLQLLKAHLPQAVRLIASDTNLGFARANNLAAKNAHGDYVLVLNPDTLIEDKYAIKKLLERLNAKPQVGLLAPAVIEPRKGNKRVPARASYPSSSQLRHTHTLKSLPGKIAWVLGACMLMKREVYQQIGGFDEDFFLYGEDADICLRVRMAGYEIDYAEDIVITHVSGASETGAPSLEKWLRKRRGIFLFYQKHYAQKDQLAIARKLIRRSRWYLFLLQIKLKVLQHSSAANLDRQARLQASIMVAKELLDMQS